MVIENFGDLRSVFLEFILLTLVFCGLAYGDHHCSNAIACQFKSLGDITRSKKLRRFERQQTLQRLISNAISMRAALYEWWNFEDEKALSDQVQRVYGQDIPLKARSE